MTDEYDYKEGFWEWSDVEGSLKYHFPNVGWTGWIAALGPAFAELKRGMQDRGMQLPEVIQVKEKLGGLRFYTRLPDKPSTLDGEWFWLQMRKIEETSLKTCRRCGEAGNLQDIDGWWTVICDDCKNVEKIEKKSQNKKRDEDLQKLLDDITERKND